MVLDKKDNDPRHPYEFKLLKKAQALEGVNTVEGWVKTAVISASGVVAAGWTKEESILLISSSGYSINSEIGECIEREPDSELTFAALDNDGLHFTIPSTEEVVSTFGLDAGDGVYCSPDGWRLEIIYPWWPQATITLKDTFNPKHRLDEYLDNTYAINLERLDGWLKCGFSPSGNKFMVIGTAGAEIFMKEK